MKIVISGGSGIGKTSVIEELASRGYLIIPETARLLLAKPQYKKFNSLYLEEKAEFQKELIKKQEKREDIFDEVDEMIFLDRSIMDVIAFSTFLNVLENITVPRILRDRYDFVFILDPLPNYKPTGRWETEEQRNNIHRLCINIYKEFGYDVVFVPVLPVKERVDFILKYIKTKALNTSNSFK